MDQYHEEEKLYQDNISVFEDELYDTHDDVKSRPFVIFRLGDEWYGVDIAFVSEVIPTQKIAMLPLVPEHIEGIINLRGNIVPVINLRPLLSVSHGAVSEKNRIIIIAYNSILVGLLNDGDEEAVEIPEELIEHLVTTLEGDVNALISGHLEWNGKLIAFLDVQKIIENTRVK
ncbi:MAG: chemotaxis protein CheW [Chlamydiota bacterium]|nr:chemotaxis protein CheW [Chlamydiota bacterium]